MDPVIQKIEIPARIEQEIEIVKGIIYTNVNLKGELRPFIIDSGAPDIILNAKYVKGEDLGDVAGKFQGVSGGGEFKVTLLEEFKWGGLCIQNKAVTAIDLSHLEEVLEKPFYGLIGHKALADFVMFIDYEQGKISLSRYLVPNGFQIKKKAPFTLLNHIPIIEARIGGYKFKFGLDTGATANLIDIKYQEKLSQHFLDVEEDQKSHGANEEQGNVQVGVIDCVKIGGETFENMSTSFSSLGHLQGAYAKDGILGYQFLKSRKMAVSFPTRELFFLE